MKKDRTGWILWVLLVLFLSMLVTIPVCSQTDKTYHATAGAVIGTATTKIVYHYDDYNYLKSLGYSTGSSTAAGIAKELYDLRMGGRFDLWDIAATTAGGLMANTLMSATHFKPYNKPTTRGWKTLAVFTGSILLDAAADATRDNGNKALSHALEAGSVATMIGGMVWIEPSWEDIGWYAASYICLRFAIFDVAYNSLRGLPLNYHGTTSMYDKFWNKMNPPLEAEMFGRVLIFSVGFSIPLQNL